MSDSSKTEALLKGIWGGKSLADLKSAAKKQFNGTAFTALKAPDGTRLILVVTITGEFELSKVVKLFGVESTGPILDWEKAMALEFVLSGVGGGIVYEAEWTADGVLSAVVLMAADPSSIRILETALGLRR